jgi:hypothetical protein
MPQGLMPDTGLCHALILLVFIRKRPGFYVAHILPDGISHHRMQIGITSEEFRRKTLIHPQHVVDHQDLSVYLRTRPDTDDGDM